LTWRKGIKGSPIFEKLDRVIAPKDWLAKYPKAQVTHGPFVFSQHCFMLLDTNPTHLPQKNRSFRFQQHWINYPTVQNIVFENWKQSVNGTTMFKMVSK